MRESSIEARLAQECSKRGILCLKFVSPGAAGVPDRLLIHPTGRMGFIEVKTSTGALSALQIRFSQQMRSRNVLWNVVRCIEDIKPALDTYETLA